MGHLLKRLVPLNIGQAYDGAASSVAGEWETYVEHDVVCNRWQLTSLVSDLIIDGQFERNFLRIRVTVLTSARVE